MSTTIKIHARRSPSSSIRWTICHASYEREKSLARERTTNHAADRGTVMHDIGEHILKAGDNEYAETRRGTRAKVEKDGVVLYTHAASSLLLDANIEVDDQLVDGAIQYADFVRNLALGGAKMLVEQRLSIEHITGEEGAKGTSDAILLFPDEICVPDLKGGFDRVFAKYPFEGDLFIHGPAQLKLAALFRTIYFPNPQLVMYAAAALKANPGPYKRVRIIIVQPMLNHIDEHVMDMDEFQQWVDWISEQSTACEAPNPRVVPGEKQCKYCSVFPCAEASNLALTTAVDDFDAGPREIKNSALGRHKRLVPFVRLWADKVDAQVSAELRAGREVPGFKLVQGDQGDREWINDWLAEYEFERAGLAPDDYTKTKIVSPAQIEKLSRGKEKRLTKAQWEAMTPIITRSPPAPKVVPDTDPRPALVVDVTSDLPFED